MFNRSLFCSHLARMVALSRSLKGYLTDQEVQFLALAASVLPPSLGEVLEIGCSRGKSTTILAKSVQIAGGKRIVAVDPFTLPAKLDDFYSNLETNGVRDVVELHRTKSQDLVPAWSRPIRLLWIDGNHTYEGALADFDGFGRHCTPGSIVAFHDVLHGFEGPIRVFCERVLLSGAYGPCGVCGSIGWSQRVSSADISRRYASQKFSLFRKLNHLIPHVVLGRSPRGAIRTIWKVRRSLVPHGELKPELWVAEVERNLASSNGG